MLDGFASPVEILVGEQPILKRSGRTLEKTGRDLGGLTVVGRVEIPAERDHVVFQKINQGGTVLGDESLPCRPERQRDSAEAAARIEQHSRHVEQLRIVGEW